MQEEAETPSVTRKQRLKYKNLADKELPFIQDQTKDTSPRKDVYDLKPLVYTEFNIEGNPHRPFIDMVLEETRASNAGSRCR